MKLLFYNRQKKSSLKYPPVTPRLSFATRLPIVIPASALTPPARFLTGHKSISNLAKIENEDIDMETVEDGIFEGHSELAPVKVDVKVLVKNHKLIKVELLRHECGLGHPADVIVDKMVEQNTWDVDAVSGATVSSEIIKNAVNKALR